MPSPALAPTSSSIVPTGPRHPHHNHPATARLFRIIHSIDWLNDWYIGWLIDWYIYSFTHPFIYSFIHAFNHSLLHSLIDRSIDSLIPFIHSSIHSLLHSFIDRLLHSLINYPGFNFPFHLLISPRPFYFLWPQAQQPDGNPGRDRGGGDGVAVVEPLGVAEHGQFPAHRAAQPAEHGAPAAAGHDRAGRGGEHVQQAPARPRPTLPQAGRARRRWRKG